MSRDRLFEQTRRTPRQTTGRELVPLPRGRCPDCGGSQRLATITQPALVRHGGYGATQVTTILECEDEACGRTRQAAVDETRP